MTYDLMTYDRLNMSDPVQGERICDTGGGGGGEEEEQNIILWV